MEELSYCCMAPYKEQFCSECGQECNAPKQRTRLQNRSLHRYFALLSEALNAAGLTTDKVLTKPIELEWTPHMVKDILWRIPMNTMYGKKSTKELTSKQVCEVYDILDRAMRKKGIEIDWPSNETQMLKSITQDI